MGKADTGNTKYREIRRSCRFLLPIYDDESLTSWLIRAALQHFCSPSIFVYYYWSERRLLTVDIDRLNGERDAPIFADMAVLSGCKNIRLHTLGDFLALGEIFVLPMNKRSQYALHGYFYCPVCMKQEETAYLRLNWRLVWAVGCPIHKVKLRNDCQKCGAVFQPQLLDPSSGGKSIAYCSNCLGWIGGNGVAVDENALALQVWADDVIANGGGVAFSANVDVSEWLKAFLFCIALIRKAVNPKMAQYHKLLLHLGIDIRGIDLFRQSASKPILYKLSQSERELLLSLVYRLLKQPASEWEVFADMGLIAKSAFGFENLIIPEPLRNFYERLPEKMISKRKKQTANIKTVEEVKRSWQFMKEKIVLQEQYEKNKKT